MDLPPRPPSQRAESGSWRDLPVGQLDLDRRHLSLRHTLACGQAFRWREVTSPPDSLTTRGEGEVWWHGVVAGRAIRLREGGDACLYQVYPADGGAGFLQRYLRLDVDLPRVVAELAGRDEGIRPALRAFPGLRVLAQDPEETLLSYLCSPANSVPRISRSIDALARLHGRLIARLDGVECHAFPSLEALAAATESDFRAVGLGWRGEGLRTVASLLLAKPPGWVAGLAGLPYGQAKAALLGLPGVGPKIADCVCLFGLGKDEAVPVDTHVWALARELFSEELAAEPIARTLTPGACERVLRLYQARYGRWAGWAQQYLYHWRRRGYPGQGSGISARACLNLAGSLQTANAHRPNSR